MRRAHLVVGLLGLLAFLLTGQYMDRVHDHLQGMADGPRLLYRTSHIYILLAAVVNLALASRRRAPADSLRRRALWLASLFALLAPWLFTVDFFLAPPSGALERPFSRLGLYGLFAAGVLLAWLGFRRSD